MSSAVAPQQPPTFMNLPADEYLPSRSAGMEGKGDDAGGIVALDSPVEWMRFCFICDGERRFVAEAACDEGLIGQCTSCLTTRVAGWTRANSEVA